MSGWGLNNGTFQVEWIREWMQVKITPLATGFSFSVSEDDFIEFVRMMREMRAMIVSTKTLPEVK